MTRKARGAGKRLVVYSSDPARLAQFDAALWTFSALDFIPHVYVDSALAASTPVLLALDAMVAPASDVLLTIDDAAPERFTEIFPRYERVIEIVTRDEADRAGARARFKAYREQGFDPTHHEVAGSE